MIYGTLCIQLLRPPSSQVTALTNTHIPITPTPFPLGDSSNTHTRQGIFIILSKKLERLNTFDNVSDVSST